MFRKITDFFLKHCEHNKLSLSPFYPFLSSERGISAQRILQKNISHAPLLVTSSHPSLCFLLPPGGIRLHLTTPPTPSKGQPEPEGFSSLDTHLTTQTP